MRAVSSPSLTENPIEIQTSSCASPKFSNKPEPNGQHHQNNHPQQLELNERGNHTGKTKTHFFS